jgi:hypothetical protein
LNKEFKQPRRFERRLERKRLRSLRYTRRKRWIRRLLLTMWYVLLVFATVSAVYHLAVGF